MSNLVVIVTIVRKLRYFTLFRGLMNQLTGVKLLAQFITSYYLP